MTGVRVAGPGGDWRGPPGPGETRLSRRVTAAQRGESPLITDTIYTIHSDNMDTSPLLQALRSESGDKVVRAMTDVSTGERTAVMSYDQMSYLLTVMVTISVVSILILIFSVTLILGFLW